ncbi:hypothetical protein [Thauera sp. AutoDN2]|jgi:hypothetical protein|uniref:hypothetical protein n=1 Tax=Thauera sp. AutoDN2 TaxID=3416051 RepID=UPI003F4B79C0
MGFFSKLRHITQWSDEDLRDELHKCTALIARQLGSMPWSDLKNVNAAMEQNKQLEAKRAKIAAEMQRRGVSESYLDDLAKKLGNPPP